MSDLMDRLEKELAKFDREYTEEEIAQELMPVICDYFIALYDMKGNEIEMSFHSGQKFKITVTQCN